MIAHAPLKTSLGDVLLFQLRSPPEVNSKDIIHVDATGGSNVFCSTPPCLPEWLLLLFTVSLKPPGMTPPPFRPSYFLSLSVCTAVIFTCQIHMCIMCLLTSPSIAARDDKTQIRHPERTPPNRQCQEMWNPTNISNVLARVRSSSDG